MTRTPFPGGSYVDATPDAWAVLYAGSHIETHLGRLGLPGADYPLYHRITMVGGFHIAGQAAASNSTLEYSLTTGWKNREASCGVSPVIYDNAGLLVISHCGPVGSQGYRYVDFTNRIWTGDETYSSPFGLFEWSWYGDLYIGQGATGGVNVWDGSVMRQLEAGDCRFVRVQGDGERVAISFRKPDSAVIWRATVAELRALPVVPPTPEPPKPDPPKPDPPKPPDPTPTPPVGPFHLAIGVHPMSPKRVGLRLGQFFASVDRTTHPFPGWFGLKFTDTSPVEAFSLVAPQAGNPKLLIRPESVPGAALSADATEYSGNISSEFGVKPDVSEAEWGGYEAWNGWQLGSDGISIVLVEYDRDGQKYTSACLTVVEL
jgi:hypothetical protein